MDREQIHHVARFLAPVGSGHLVGGEIGRMQDIAEGVVPDSGEKTKIAIGDPL